MPVSPREAREILGLSQSEMAKACNTSIGTVTKWDQRQREPRGQAARLIEVLLELKEKGMLDWYIKKFS